MYNVMLVDAKNAHPVTIRKKVFIVKIGKEERTCHVLNDLI